MTVDVGLADGAAIGHNLNATIADLDKRMKEAAGNLEFEEAARLRDEIKRLQTVALAVGDDPLARQTDVEAVSRRLSGRTQIWEGRKHALDPAPQADRRRHGPAQLGRRRSAPEGRGEDAKGGSENPSRRERGRGEGAKRRRRKRHRPPRAAAKAELRLALVQLGPLTLPLPKGEGARTGGGVEPGQGAAYMKRGRWFPSPDGRGAGVRGPCRPSVISSPAPYASK